MSPTSPSSLTPRRLGRWATAAVLLATCLALAACGGHGDPGDRTSATPPPPHSPVPASSTSSAVATPTASLAGIGDRCGVVTAPGGERFRLTVRDGRVDCARARKIFRTYLTKLRHGEAPGNGGGPVHVRGWTCVSGEAPGSTCHDDQASFAAKPV